MRLLVKFTKKGGAVYMSHLDLLRCVQRVMRRANLPLKYSQGFNPHPILSFAQALGLGLSSEGEYFEVELTEAFEPKDFVCAFNANAPHGVKALEARAMGDKEKSAMAQVQAAEYIIYPQKDYGKIEQALESFCALGEYTYIKKSKSGHKEADMRGRVLSARYEADDKAIHCLLQSGNENLQARVFFDALCDIAQTGTTCEILRKDLLRKGADGRYVSFMSD